MTDVDRYVRLEVDEDRREEYNARRQSTFFAGVTYIKSTVGVGIFAIPFAFSRAGMWVGTMGLALIALVTWYTVTLLIAARIRANASDYASVGRAAAGKFGVFLTLLAVITTQIGTVTVQALFITGSLNFFVPAVPRYAWFLILCPIYVLLSWIRQVNRLSIISFFAVMCLLVAVITVFVFGFMNFPPGDVIAAEVNHAPVDFFLFYGIIIYVFEGINMSIPIHREMRNPDLFFSMFTIVTLILLFSFLSMGIFGYIFFLDAVQQIILQNLPQSNVWTMIVISLVIIELLLSFPVVFFPVTWAVENTIAPSFFGKDDGRTFTSVAAWKRNIVRTVLVFVVVLPATLIPRISLAVTLAGAFSNSLAGIILPTLFNLLIFWDDSRVIKKIFLFIIIGVGVFTMAVTSTIAIVQIANAIAGNS